MLNGRKLLCAALIVMSANLAYGNMKEDIAFLNELYRQGRYDMALSQSEKFISDYPDSKYNKSICEKMAKVHFMQNKYVLRKQRKSRFLCRKFKK